MLIFDILGWLGMGMAITAYLLLSTGKMKPGKTYQILNLVSALILMVALYPKNAWFSFFAQFVWGGVAVAALIKLHKTKSAKYKPTKRKSTTKSTSKPKTVRVKSKKNP